MSHTPETHPGGRWVPVDEVHPLANITERAFRLEDGRVGVYNEHWRAINYLGLDRLITHWYFAPPEKGVEQ